MGRATLERTEKFRRGKVSAITTEDTEEGEDGHGFLIPDSLAHFPARAGESQGDTTITVSPSPVRRLPPSVSPGPPSPPPHSSSPPHLPPSTVPPRLEREQEEGGGSARECIQKSTSWDESRDLWNRLGTRNIDIVTSSIQKLQRWG